MSSLLVLLIYLRLLVGKSHLFVCFVCTISYFHLFANLFYSMSILPTQPLVLHSYLSLFFCCEELHLIHVNLSSDLISRLISSPFTRALLLSRLLFRHIDLHGADSYSTEPEFHQVMADLNMTQTDNLTNGTYAIKRSLTQCLVI